MHFVIRFLFSVTKPRVIGPLQCTYGLNHILLFRFLYLSVIEHTVLSHCLNLFIYSFLSVELYLFSYIYVMCFE